MRTWRTPYQSALDHCLRALDHGDTRGPHGLPLIGGGDWNDGMNRLRLKGRGESVWLGWFLCSALEDGAALCERVGDGERAARQEAQIDLIAQAWAVISGAGDPERAATAMASARERLWLRDEKLLLLLSGGSASAPLADDGRRHRVKVRLGARRGAGGAPDAREHEP